MQAKANTVTSSAKLYGRRTIRVFRPERASCNSSKAPQRRVLGNETGGVPFTAGGVATLQMLLGCRCGRPGDSFLTLHVQAHQWAAFSVDSPWSDKSHVAKISCHDVCLYSMYGMWLGRGQNNRQMTGTTYANLSNQSCPKYLCPQKHLVQPSFAWV